MLKVTTSSLIENLRRSRITRLAYMEYEIITAHVSRCFTFLARLNPLVSRCRIAKIYFPVNNLFRVRWFTLLDKSFVCVRM